MSSQESSGIIRVQKKDNYSVINNTPITDERLSWQARGMLCYLLSKPDNWETRLNDLVKKSPAGEDAVKSIISELKHFGYVERIRERQPDGTFLWITKVHETPVCEQNVPFARRKRKNPATPETPALTPVVDNPPLDENHEITPVVDYPRVEQPLVDNPPIYISTDLKSTDLKNTDEKELSLSPTENSPGGKTQNQKRGEREVLSKYSYQDWYEYIKHCKEVLGEPVGSIEAVAESNFYKGIRDERLGAWKAEREKEKEKPVIAADELKFVWAFCPHCFGAGHEVIAGKGARKCAHQGLLENLKEKVEEKEIDAELVRRYEEYFNKKGGS